MWMSNGSRSEARRGAGGAGKPTLSAVRGSALALSSRSITGRCPFTVARSIAQYPPSVPCHAAPHRRLSSRASSRPSHFSNANQRVGSGCKGWDM
eukprot:907739-Rhodomonas_salina.5